MDKSKLAKIPTKMYEVVSDGLYNTDQDTLNQIKADIQFGDILNENRTHIVEGNKVIQEALGQAIYPEDCTNLATANKIAQRDGAGNCNFNTLNCNNLNVSGTIYNTKAINNSFSNAYSIGVRNNSTGAIEWVNDFSLFRNIIDAETGGTTAKLAILASAW
jgi:hypothetical protein